MALSDLIFTNNLGTITMTRVMYSISHTYTWDGANPAKPGIEIRATGVCMNTEAQFNSVAGTGVGWGTLTLPHATLGGMRIRELTYEDGVWARWGTVTAVFNDTNDTDPSDISIEFKSEFDSIVIYNPSVVFYPSTIRRGDSMIYGMNGWIRQQLGHELIRISVTGDVNVDPCVVPEGVLGVLEQKMGKPPELANYPRVASLSDFTPSAKDNFDISHVMIESAKMTWYYEDNVADVEINMVAPPQKVLFTQYEGV